MISNEHLESWKYDSTADSVGKYGFLLINDDCLLSVWLDLFDKTDESIHLFK